MTELQQKLVELAGKKEELVKQLKELSEVLDPIMAQLGDGAMFQSPEGLVYKVQKPTGQYVTYKEYEYVRTKRNDEKRGTLAKSEAKDAGFVVL